MEQKTDNNYRHYIPLEERIKAGYMMTERDKLGKTVSENETETQISRRHLYDLEKRNKADFSMMDKARSGRPPKVNSPLNRRIVRTIVKNPFQSSLKMTKEVNMSMEEEKQISASTFRRHVFLKGFISRRPCQKPKLTGIEEILPIYI